MNAPIDITGVELKTPRLILRPWRAEDLDDFYAYARVDGVGQMAGWLPHQSIEESRTILNHFIEGRRTFALERDGRAVGSLGVELYDEARFPEYARLKCRSLGFVLAKDQWGEGLMPEAVNEALRWLFCDVGLDAVFCAHFVRNTRSMRVQQKCGFHPIARGEFATRFGTVEEDVVNILTRQEYMAR